MDFELNTDRKSRKNRILLFPQFSRNFFQAGMPFLDSTRAQLSKTPKNSSLTLLVMKWCPFENRKKIDNFLNQTTLILFLREDHYISSASIANTFRL